MSTKDIETKGISPRRLPLHKLFVAADGLDYVLMLGGSIGAAVHGLAMPIFLFLLRKLLNGFTELHHDKMYHEVTKYASYMVFLGIISMFSSWAEVALWMQTGERQVSKLRVAYLRAMLKQDIAYFDVHAKSVSAISNNMVIIQNAISEKMGSFIHFFFTFVGGFIFGFATVWRLGLVTLAVIPLLAAVGGLHLRSLTHLQSKHQELYKTPASSAEEVISQIRTVYSFVGERRALESYSEALKPCLKLGLKTGAVKGLGVGTMYASIVSSFAFLLWYGSLLVRQGHATGGSVLSTVFEVLVGGMYVQTVQLLEGDQKP